jgi:signal transduction histidine kinase
MNILIVDDIEKNRKLLRATLEAGGHRVQEAVDGQEALAVLEQKPTDAIISDLLMPRMDGYSLCSQVRRTDRFRNVPIIIYTSRYTSPADERLALHVGADRYIKKPAPSQVLLDALQESCSAAASRQRRAHPLPEELTTLRDYNAVLVRKLEERNTELEAAQKSLTSDKADLEQQVRERTAELHAANESLEAFAHSVSHDLRTPVRHIGAFTQLVVDDSGNTLTDPSRRDLNTVIGATQTLSRMIEGLLKFSRTGSGGLQMTSVELGGMVNAVRRDLEEEAKGRQIRWKIGPLPTVKADATLLRQVLANLLSNAVKYTRHRPVAEIEITSQSGEQGETVVVVRDNGVGFEMKYADKLFSVFKRLHSPEQFEGVGVGLATVRRIIERHGGKVWADAKVDQGATFCFSLPAAASLSPKNARPTRGGKPAAR